MECALPGLLRSWALPEATDLTRCLYSIACGRSHSVEHNHLMMTGARKSKSCPRFLKLTAKMDGQLEPETEVRCDSRQLTDWT